jgi:type IX secretion system PorP/SprF family membrane protein
MKRLLLTSVIAAFATIAHAQDPFFTQQNYGLAYINPAYTGAFACGRAELGYRIQWPKLQASYQTFNAAYDQYFSFGGVGFAYSHDRSGSILTTDRFDFNYAYGFGIGEAADGKAKVVIQPGVQLSYFRKTVDWSQLTFGDMIDPRRGFVYPTSQLPASGAVNCFDVSAGVMAYSDRIIVGMSAYHINQPDEGFLGKSRLPVRVVAHAAGIIGNADGSGFSIVPSVVFMQQDNAEMITGLVTAKYNAFSLGVGYRNEDAMLFTAGYSHGNFTLGYSYDYTISELENANTGGAHEVHLAYCFMKDQWSGTRRNVQQFF